MCTCLEITQDGPRGRYDSPTGRCARAIRATAEASHWLCTSIAAGWTAAASAGWLSLVSFACIQFLHVRPRRRSPYSPREHAGATGFLLNETSHSALPSPLFWWHARLRSRTCHRQALTTHAIASRHCPLDIPGTDIRSAVIVFGDPSVYLSNPAFQVPALLIARGTTGRTRGCTACR